MVSVSQVQQCEDFLRDKYKQKLEELADAYPDQKSLIVDYTELDRYDSQLADDLLENPDDILKAFEQAAKQMKYVDSQGKPIGPKVRFTHFPEKDFPNYKLIRNINSNFINKILVVKGAITKITDVQPKVEMGVFQCVHCGNKYRIMQTNELYGQLKEPGQCTCQRNSYKLDLEESSFTDMQKMQIQEPLEAIIRGEQAKTIDIWLEGDLTNKLYPGDKVMITGILRLIPPKKKGSVYHTYIDAVHIEKVEKEFEELDLTPEEEKQIRELAKDSEIYDKIIKSVAPSIYGYREVKEALALQLFGGTRGKALPDGVKIRPDMHILLIGDPGTAKSQLLSYIYSLSPKGVFVSGKSATGAGITATAERDEFGDGGWTLKAGALVLASGGHAMIDEFSQMSEEDRSSMHEAMEQQRISIAKAGIVTTFKSETSILAAANPKFGRFDPYEPPADQFNIPPTILSRFDLIFPIRDIVDEERDRNMSEHILNGHRLASSIRYNDKSMTEEQIKTAEEKITPILDPDMLRKYIAYARKTVNPILTDEALQKIQEYYVELRKMGEQQGAIAATPRQLEGIVRLAEASAKGRLSNYVEIEDAERAKRLHQYVMREIMMDRETGHFDVDLIAIGKPKSKTDRARTLLHMIRQLCDEHDTLTHELIVEEAKETGMKVDDIDELLSMLKKGGDIYTPRHGEYKIADH